MQTEPHHSDFVDDTSRAPHRATPGERRHRWAAFSILGVAGLLLLGVFVVWQTYLAESVAISQSALAWLAVGAVAIGLLLGGIAASIIYATGD